MSEFYAQAAQIPKKVVAVVQEMKKKRIKHKEVFIALFDYTPAPGRKDCLKFLKDDEFTLKDENSVNQKWILVKHTPTGKKGFVPKNFVARESDKELLEWCNLDNKREEAVERLRSVKYGSGAFIIRSTSLQGGCGYSEALALSVKYMAGDAIKILHYSILRENGQFSLKFDRRNSTEAENKDTEIAFPSLRRLVMCLARFPVGIQQRLTYSVKKDCPIDTWTIDRDEIEFGEKKIKIGFGHFSEVFKATIDGREVAVKKLTLERGMTKEQFITEADTVKKFNHPNIVRTIGVCAAVPYIVTEFLTGGNLKDYIEKRPKKLSDLENLEIARQIACAMAHLERLRIVHRDLAARNILVGSSHNIIKLSDFGLARRLLEDKLYYQNNVGVFPLKWAAPEAYVITDNGAFSQVGKSSTASDVWSFAVVLWELYSKGKTPYPDLDGLEIFHKLTKENYRLCCPTNCPVNTIYAKMLECWSLDTSKRPTFAQLLKFLQDPYRGRDESAGASGEAEDDQ